MDRGDFLKMMGAGASAAFIVHPTAGDSNPDEEQVIQSQDGRDWEGLYRIFHERGEVDIAGFKFTIHELKRDSTFPERKVINLHLQTIVYEYQ